MAVSNTKSDQSSITIASCLGQEQSSYESLNLSRSSVRFNLGTKMSDSKSFDISTFIEGEFDYSAVFKDLPKMIAKSNKIIKLKVAGSKPFYAFYEDTLLSLIENLAPTEEHVASFFDGMESFESGERTGMEALDSIEPRAPEYDKGIAKKLFDK